MHLCEQLGIDAFRLNMDLHYKYQFLWQEGGFEIIDPLGRVANSENIDYCAMFKNQLNVCEDYEWGDRCKNPQWICSTLNCVSAWLAAWANEKKILRLWQPSEYPFPKNKQMDIARKYFRVPTFSLHWGFQMSNRRVVAKTLTGRSLDDGSMPYVKIVERESLDPIYPWFTQEPAKGNRDATVLYVNGRVHCYQFATKRGELTDWRVTQGTDANKWESWDAGEDFEDRVRSYMHALSLKFGRLDFIIGGDAPEFLEVNPCGQFGWLDDGKFTLHREVLAAIMDPSSTIEP